MFYGYKITPDTLLTFKVAIILPYITTINVWKIGHDDCPTATKAITIATAGDYRYLPWQTPASATNQSLSKPMSTYSPIALEGQFRQKYDEIINNMQWIQCKKKRLDI